MGRLRDRRGERARAPHRDRRLRLPARHRRRRGSGHRSSLRLPRMIDVRAARADPDTWRAALARKGAAEIFDEFLQADEAWRAANTRVDELRAARKPSGKGKPSPEEIERLNTLKEELKQAEAARTRDELLTRIPNPPDASAPDGFTEEDAVEVRRSGDPPRLDFEARDHL